MIIEQCARQRLPLPQRIANSPELFLGLNLYYVAFLELTTCRGSTYGSEGPVSWLTINEYANAKGFEDEQREDLFFFMGRMDAAYLEFKTQRLKDANKPSILGADGTTYKVAK